MKLWKLVFLIFLTSNASAFFTNDNIEILQKNIHITVEGGSAHVEITTELHNPTETEIVFQVIEPLGQGKEVVNFFVNMEGKAYSLLEGKERLEYLFAQAKEREKAFLFGWGADQYPKLFRSENLAIGAQQKVRTKNVFNIPIQTQDDFDFLELFLSEDVPTEISFTLEQPVEYFIHSLGESAMVYRGETTTLLWTGEAGERVSFLWSDFSNAEIGVSFLGMEYRARFVKPPKKDIQEVTILIDRSGSLMGLPWQRAKDWTEFLLETFGEDVRVRIGFFSDEIAWHEEEFQPNTYEFKKDFFGFLSGIAPVGKTDMGEIFNLQSSIFKKSETQKHVVILITDQESLENGIFTRERNTPFIVLQFAENLENDLALFSEISGGFPIKLFRSSPDLVEKEEFLKKLNSLNTKIVQDEEWEMQDKVPDFFPSQMRTEPFFFTGRNMVSSQMKNVSAGHFVPRAWGSGKIAEILEKENRQTSDLDALLAIGRTFGISTKFFNDKTTRGELEENLDSASNMELRGEIYNLQLPIFNFQLKKEMKFLNGIPLYRIKERDSSANSELRLVGMTKEGKGEGNRWQQFNFPELVRAESHIQIAPFSEAQRQLFIQFPEFVAEGFGVAREVDFCTEFRCISVLDGERVESKPSDRAFFKDYDANHWAHGYIVRAVEEGLLEPALNGKLHPDRAIDRGEFAKLVVKAFWLELGSGPQEIPGPDPNFSDVHDPEYFDAVQLLAQKGIVKGYQDGTFRPLQSLTRAEGVKMLISISDFGFSISDLEGIEPPFSDTTGWEKPWVAEAVRRGMVKGYGDGTFRPHGKLTRAEALKLVFEMR